MAWLMMPITQWASNIIMYINGNMYVKISMSLRYIFLKNLIEPLEVITKNKLLFDFICVHILIPIYLFVKFINL